MRQQRQRPEIDAMQQAPPQPTALGRLSSPADGGRRWDWPGGSFQTAQRPPTTRVEGTIRSDRHLVMVTLRGGADRHEIRADDGHRYDGPDRPGSASFLPAGCERRLRLSNVAWRWAAVALDPGADDALAGVPPVSAIDDRFLFGLLAELDRLDAHDGGLDAAYCDAMGIALSHYVARRFGGAGASRDEPIVLPAWRLRRVIDYVEAHLDGPIRITDLARCADLSPGHFHRAFRAATGQTPLTFIQQQRIDRAMQLLAKDVDSILHIALRVGFISPAHFARVFRTATGETPSAFRRRHAVGG
jgi:AraC family transcriptional regulator